MSQGSMETSSRRGRRQIAGTALDASFAADLYAAGRRKSVGYSAGYFSTHVARWLDQGWLFPGARLIEFGAQEFYCDPQAARDHTRAFLAARGKSAAEIDAAIGRSGAIHVADVYRALGIEYVAIDVDGAYGSTFFDLNTFAPPPEWLGAFDMVNNEGTIEHLINPINGFQVTHELLKPGGVARHSAPLSGCRDHGMFHPTSGFYLAILNENRYELLEGRANGQPAKPWDDPLFKTAEPFEIVDLWGSIIYRKQIDDAFRPPADHLLTARAGAIASRLAADWAAYSAHRFNGNAPRRGRFDLWRWLLYTRRWLRSVADRRRDRNAEAHRNSA
jgi:SAM-dependent methyltransferase